MHARDIIDTFVRRFRARRARVHGESQLRFSDQEGDDIQINQCTGKFNFGYEYMGLNGRLVITGLTDRCYMTITTALTYMLGAAPDPRVPVRRRPPRISPSPWRCCASCSTAAKVWTTRRGSIFSGLVQWRVGMLRRV